MLTDYEKYRGKRKEMSEALVASDPSLRPHVIVAVVGLVVIGGFVYSAHQHNARREAWCTANGHRNISLGRSIYSTCLTSDGRIILHPEVLNAK